MLLFAILGFTLSSCEDKGPKGEEYKGAPEQIISAEQAKKIYDTYTERRVGLIKAYEEDSAQGGKEFHPTRSGWYDYETIKQYMAYIEHEAKLAGVEISGLRFYFANYPETAQFKDDRMKEYPRHNTFFIMPTMSLDGEDMGFITTGKPDGERKAVLIRDRVLKMTGNRDTTVYRKEKQGVDPKMMVMPLMLQEGDEERSLILNEAGLTPPPPTKSEFDN